MFPIHIGSPKIFWHIPDVMKKNHTVCRGRPGKIWQYSTASQKSLACVIDITPNSKLEPGRVGSFHNLSNIHGHNALHQFCTSCKSNTTKPALSRKIFLLNIRNMSGLLQQTECQRFPGKSERILPETSHGCCQSPRKYLS